MSRNSKSDGKPKSSRLGTLMTEINSKSQVPAFVPPVLKEVGKLAAGVASVSTSNTSSGSATGNPRNKVGLQPGHSLMDWIRLGASGKDLTGLGPKAGRLTVTKQELAKHNDRDNAWMAIRGNVYNITSYFPFHPGGENELMKGVGIDATTLFDQVHPWVNYEKILQKCLVGKLVPLDGKADVETLIFEEKELGALISPSSSENQLTDSVINGGPTKSSEQSPAMPRFDWFQKMDSITIIFYTEAFSNPFVEVSAPSNEKTVRIFLDYQDTIYHSELVFYEEVRWPCKITVSIETGKVELVFRKMVGCVWENYGMLKQLGHTGNRPFPFQIRLPYVLKKKKSINYNTWLLQFERKDGEKEVIPVGEHVRISSSFDGEEISRSYTPVPECLFNEFVPNYNQGNSVCLTIKRYPDGNISKMIVDKNIGDVMEITKPFGRFDLKRIEIREIFLLLAAGTGITPMLGIILFLLERRMKKCQFVRLLFFNRTEKDILFKSQMEDLEKRDQRFKVTNILSEPTDAWRGPLGYVNSDFITQCFDDLEDTGNILKNMFVFICGPIKFNLAAVEALEKVNLAKEQIHRFEG